MSKLPQEPDGSSNDTSSAAANDGPHNVKLSCGMCDSNTLETERKYCSTCGVVLCKKCVDGHRRIPALRSHPISDTMEPGASVVLYDPCAAHPLSLLQYFCTKCLLPVCSDCRLERHKDHEAVDIQKQAEENRERLGDKLELLDAELKRRSKRRDELKQRIDKFKPLYGQATKTTLSDRNSMIHTINQVFDRQQSDNDVIQSDLDNCLSIADRNIKTISALKKRTPVSLTDLALLTPDAPVLPMLPPVFSQGRAEAMLQLINPENLNKEQFIVCMHNRIKHTFAQWILPRVAIVKGSEYRKIQSSKITTLSGRWVDNLQKTSADWSVSLEPVEHTQVLRAMEPDTYYVTSTEDARHLRTLFGSANEHDIPEIKKSDFNPDTDIYILRIKDSYGIKTKLMHGDVGLPEIKNKQFSCYSRNTVAQVIVFYSNSNYKLIEL